MKYLISIWGRRMVAKNPKKKLEGMEYEEKVYPICNKCSKSIIMI